MKHGLTHLWVSLTVSCCFPFAPSPCKPCRRTWLIILQQHLSPQAQAGSTHAASCARDTQKNTLSYNNNNSRPGGGLLTCQAQVPSDKNSTEKQNAPSSLSLLRLSSTQTQTHTHFRSSVTGAERWSDACGTPTCCGTRSDHWPLCWHVQLMCSETKTADRWLINPPHCRVHIRRPDTPGFQVINIWCSQTWQRSSSDSQMNVG